MIHVTLPRTTTRKVTPYFQCVTCCGLFVVRHKGSVKRSCVDCEELRRLAKEAAHGKLYREIKAGNVTPPTAHKCVDCGAKATMYDHRSYAEPLNVQPVCRRCNMARGPARL